uniref:Flagellar associated protein n=1 Tax=Tetraselmis sp. GSL018 TaxID=582737 RepID=A0A061RHJ4_9CHLO
MVENGPSSDISVMGIGKFPHLRIEQSSISFGEVYVGHQATKRVSLFNPSLVPAHYESSCADSTAARPVFRVAPAKGTVAPGEHIVLEITFTPVSAGTQSIDTFELATRGGNKVRLSAQGTALGTVVTASAPCIDFGSVEVGGTATRSLSLTNESGVEARYEFLCDPDGVFAFREGAVRGVIPAAFTRSLTVEFRPASPSHHWKRAACLVGNGSPLQIDLLGTGFTEKLRPPHLAPSRIEEYLARVDAGGNPLCDASEPIAADPQELNFGACSRLRPADHRAVELKNRTSAKLTVYPTVPHADGAGGDEPIFRVFPESADIRPGEAATFRVAFRPPRDGQYLHGGARLHGPREAHAELPAGGRAQLQRPLQPRGPPPRQHIPARARGARSQVRARRP